MFLSIFLAGGADKGLPPFPFLRGLPAAAWKSAGYECRVFRLAENVCLGVPQYDMTWFINPNPLPYFEIVALEHGYIRAEVNATTFHISVRAHMALTEFQGASG